jgi:DNA-binding NarL/FixJ family response regulator
MIRVALVDDQTLMREGLRKLLELTTTITVVAEAADGAEALALIPGVAPDVVLLDVRMPRVSGLDVLRTLRERGELPPTILLTTFDDDAALLAGIRYGARGFLLKDVSLADLTRAIEDVAAGGTVDAAGRHRAHPACRDPGAAGIRGGRGARAADAA